MLKSLLSLFAKPKTFLTYWKKEEKNIYRATLKGYEDYVIETHKDWKKVEQIKIIKHRKQNGHTYDSIEVLEWKE